MAEVAWGSSETEATALSQVGILMDQPSKDTEDANTVKIAVDMIASLVQASATHHAANALERIADSLADIYREM